METQEPRPGPIETQLRAWTAELDRLKAKVDERFAAARKEYYERIEELREDIEAHLAQWRHEVESLDPGSTARKVVQDLRARIEADLQAWQPEVDALKAKAGRAEAEARKLIDEVRARRRAQTERLSGLKHATEGAWEDVKAGAAKAWDELRPALQSAIAKFR